MSAGKAARLAAMAAALAAALAARPASAYVRYITEYGKPFQWMQSCVHVTGYPNQDDFPDMTPDQVLVAASRAAGAWSTADNTCTYLNVDVTLSSATAPEAIADNQNSLIFRHQDWCSPTDKPWTCSYDQAALAITSVFVQRSSGRIQEADIEVNDRYFTWTDLDVDPDKTKQDLQNALTHEMGHLIGLDHTCYSPSPTIVRPTDNEGNPVPDCGPSSPPDVQATTMYASAPPGDTSKRSLEADDKQAICAIYPLASDPAYCPTVGTSSSSSSNDKAGCALAAGSAPQTPWSLSAGLAWVLVLAAWRHPSRAGRAR